MYGGMQPGVHAINEHLPAVNLRVHFLHGAFAWVLHGFHRWGSLWAGYEKHMGHEWACNNEWAREWIWMCMCDAFE